MTKRTLIRGIKPAIGFLALGLGLGTMGWSQPALAQMGPEWHNCLTREVFTPEKQAWCDRWNTLQNGTYLVPTTGVQDSMYTTVTLTNGQYEAEDGGGVALANEPGWLAFGDLNGDGKDDAAVIMGVVPADGTALSTHLAVVMDIDGSAQALNPVLLGERVMLNSFMAINNQRLLVPQLTQTEVINRTFVTDGGTLSELAQLPTPERVPGGIPDGTLVFTNTSTYAVRVFTQEGQPYVNLFNRRTGRLEVDSGRAVAISSVEGTQYRYSGTGDRPSVQITVAPDSAQTFEVNGMEQTDLATVTGTVTHRVRMALAPNTVVEVQLLDVSRADAPAIVLASQSIVTGGRQVPIPFELVYNPDQIDPRMTYAVQARISVDGNLQFINTRRFPVISQGNPNQVEVMVDPVRR
ncbi:MAG: YbaY family lipoprotein [Spirulina sp.]